MPKIPVNGGWPGVFAPASERRESRDVAPPGENALRRAREAAGSYAAEADVLLNDPDGGFLSLAGSAAAEGLRAFAAGEERLRRAKTRGLSGGERALYAALTQEDSAKTLDAARRWAASQAKKAHSSMIDAELHRLGVETWLSADTPEGRAELLAAAVPRAERLGAEKARILGIAGEGVSDVTARCLKALALSSLDAGAKADPVGAAGYFTAVSPFLSPGEERAEAARLKPLVTRALAEGLRDEALSLADSPEDAETLVAEARMPREVTLLALTMVRAGFAARRAARRKEEEATEALARRIMEENFGDPSAVPTDLWASLSGEARRRLGSGVPLPGLPDASPVAEAVRSKLAKLTGGAPDAGTVARVLMAKSLNECGALDDQAGAAVVAELVGDLSRRP